MPGVHHEAQVGQLVHGQPHVVTDQRGVGLGGTVRLGQGTLDLGQGPRAVAEPQTAAALVLSRIMSCPTSS